MKRVRLTESRLRNIIRESINEVINEGTSTIRDDYVYIIYDFKRECYDAGYGWEIFDDLRWNNVMIVGGPYVEMTPAVEDKVMELQRREYGEANESVRRGRLVEAADDTFSFDELDDWYSKITEKGFDDDHLFTTLKVYCEKHLGAPDAKGSSRIVYQIDDNRVLKLAKNKKGIAQNKVESACYKMSTYNNELFPKIFGKSKYDLWIDCEFVLPARENDFRECTNYSWTEICDLIDKFSRYNGYANSNRNCWFCQEIDKIVANDKFLAELFKYVTDDNVCYGDIQCICNWGMTRRNGITRMVILDSGLTWDVWKEHYTM